MITSVTPNVALDKYYVVPGFALSGVHRVQQMKVLPSGKGLNVARVLHTLGVKVQATGVVAGYTGQRICQDLDAIGLTHDFIWVEGESRLCLTVVDPTANVHTELLEPGPSFLEATAAALEHKVRLLAKYSTFVAISGSPPDGAPENLLFRLVAAARGAGARTLLDARSQWLRLGLNACPDIIKPNWEEFTALFGPCASWQEAAVKAKPLVEQGVSVVLVSRGAEGVLAVTAAGCWVARPPQVAVVSAVGCGDAMVGGLLAALTKDADLVTALRMATAVAASNACHLGAGECDLDQVQKILPQVLVEALRL